MSGNTNNNEGAQGVAKSVTSTFGNLAGGLTKTLGSGVGAVGKGVGDTINSTTGTTAVGNGLKAVTDGVDSGSQNLGKAAEDAGQWKTS